MDDRKALEGEVLQETVEVPPVHDVTPGWVGRNRRALERGRNLTRALMVVAPPQVRVPLAVASLVTDVVLLSDDLGRRREDRVVGGVRGAALALEGVAVLATTRFAPLRLAANLGGIEAARRALERAIAAERRA
ncbi:MAG: hypothetical protein AAGK00_19400 [Pseudomonadota bacterium]